MTPKETGSGSRSAMTLADFEVIAGVMRLALWNSGLRMSRLERHHGWYAGIISAWLRGTIALPVERFGDLLEALDLGTHEFFALVYRNARVPRESKAQRAKPESSQENLATCFRFHLRHEIRSRGFKQSEVERKVGWTPRYLSTLLAGRRPLSLLHCLAVVRAIDLTPAEFFLSLDCERTQSNGEKTPGEGTTPADS